MASAFDLQSTSPSLLRRVRRFETDAWTRLSALYGPVVYGWCRRAGLQSSDAADAVQEVFRSVFRGIGEFRGTEGSRSGGSFRGWLWTVTRNQVHLHHRKHENVPLAVGGTDAQVRMGQKVDSSPSLGDSEPDAELTQRRLLHRALDLVRADFNDSTWNAFTRVTLQSHAISEVAADLGLTENAVRQAKFRVLRRLREELDES